MAGKINRKFTLLHGRGTFSRQKEEVSAAMSMCLSPEAVCVSSSLHTSAGATLSHSERECLPQIGNEFE